MCSEDLKKFRQMLYDLHGQISEQKIDESRLRGEKITEEFEQASLIIDQSLVTNLLTRKSLYLKQIEFALKKIDNGDYGYCEECGDNIALRRLEARPTAQYCVGCKSKLEKMKKKSQIVGLSYYDKVEEPEKIA